LVANVIILLSGSWDELLCDFNNVALVLLDAVGNHVLDESIETGYLLVHHTVLLEEGINNLPLVINVDLVLTEFFYIKLRV